jgi:hypothetical protein
LLAKANFLSQFNAICLVQSLAQKQFPSRPPQISTINSAVSSLTRGVSRSSRTRDGMRWTRQRQAREVVRRAVIRERARRARRTALKRTAKPCGSGTRGWCQAAGGEFDPTGSISHQAGSDGGKRNSSPGRARHKPSNHCAGNAGVLRLYLYARVRTSSCTLHTRPRVQQAPGIPCSLSGGTRFMQASGASRAARRRGHVSER